MYKTRHSIATLGAMMCFGTLLCSSLLSISCTNPLIGRDTKPVRQIDIAIRDHTFIPLTQEAIRIGTPTVLTVRNDDAVTHGFLSSMLTGVPVQEDGGTKISVNDKTGFHVDPGHTVTVRFTPDRLGTLDFQCDLHPEEKGEIAYTAIHLNHRAEIQ